MPAILFVCTANQYRSPIAAACLLKRIGPQAAGKDWIVASAGTWTQDGLRAPVIALQVAGRLGLRGLERHRSRQIHRKLLEEFDLIIVMELNHKQAICSEFPSVCSRLVLLSEAADGLVYDVPDPVDAANQAEDVGHEIETLIGKGWEKILRLAEEFSRSRGAQRSLS